MADDIEVDPDVLRSVADHVRVATDYVDAAAKQTEEADPDWWMWGLPGLVFAGPYFGLATAWRHFMDKTNDAIEGTATRLDGMAEGHDSMDSLLGETFTGMLTDITDAAGTYKRETRYEDPMR